MEGLVPRGLRCDSSILWLAFPRTHSQFPEEHTSPTKNWGQVVFIEVQIMPFCRKYFHWLYIALLSGVEKYSLVWQGRPRKTWWNPLLVLILIPLFPTPPSLLYLYWSSLWVPFLQLPKMSIISTFFSYFPSKFYSPLFLFSILYLLNSFPILRLS